MDKIFGKIPNRILNNQEVSKMIDYLNEALKDIEIVVLERINNSEKDAFIAEPKEIYEENLRREKNGEKIIREKNVITCWEYMNSITITIKPNLQPKKFFSLSQLEEEKIHELILKKYNNLLGKDDLNSEAHKLENLKTREIKIVESEGESIMKDDSKNIILYGPPGTGKTFNVVNKALEIINPIRYSELMRNNCSREELSNEFNKLLEIGQISFCTFHQSYSYEDFVEGLRSDDEGNGFVPKDGIFKQICKTASEKIEKRGSKYEFEEENINFYKMSLGSKDGDYDIYKYCIDNDCIALGKGGDVDYKNCSNKEEIKNEYLKQYPSAKSDEFDIDAMNRFKLWMEKDDIVIISYGNLKARAIGKVTGDYYYDPNTEISYSHFRKVEWLYVSDGIDVKRILNEKKFSQQSIYQFYKKDLNIENIKDLISATEINSEEKKYVLIIDEINRGNISKIFGELITLIEEDKRLGEKNQIKVTLPYSNEPFGVPSNLYIIGTMNTADRSIALLDTALRRRFEFIEYMPNPELLSENVDGINLKELLKVINRRIEFLFDRDHTIGHAFFIKDNLNFEGIVEIMNKKIIPLLQEYFYGDFEKIELILGGAGKPGENNYFITKEKVNPRKLFNNENISNEYPSQYKYAIVENPSKDAFINLYSSVKAED
ncbi:AAA family ATPase [Clostridium sp. YIM B02569]|uniref:AAA family ATPase n=1 Tax=Clostridium sp. YIM B02569 TaxID=2911967 RepID=UPI001EEAA0D6|nr:AAA family ATPase [Clostridium sp. YIM B02569]